MHFHTTPTPLAPSPIHLSPASLPFPIASFRLILSTSLPPSARLPRTLPCCRSSLLPFEKNDTAASSKIGRVPYSTRSSSARLGYFGKHQCTNVHFHWSPPLRPSAHKYDFPFFVFALEVLSTWLGLLCFVNTMHNTPDGASTAECYLPIRLIHTLLPTCLSYFK